MPDLHFRVESAGVLEHAAAPSLLLRLHVENRGPETVRGITLHTQLRIVPDRRSYDPGEQDRLRALFGTPEQWGQSLQSLLWTHTVVQVPPFTGGTRVEMPVPCTYDFEVVSTRYFHALEEGDVPLDLLFSGTVFYAGETGLQAARISWDREARFHLPVRLWKEMMEHYFPNSAWLRLRRDVFDRLLAYRSCHALPTWEAAVERLLDAGEGAKPPWTR